MTIENNRLLKILLDQQIAIETWLREQFRLTPPPFYASMDLRNAGFKIAPVDTNLFPAGFNNLNPQFMPLYIQAMQATLQEICPDVCKILLIPESHTRNFFYLENVAILQEIIDSAGFAIRLGSLLPELTAPQEIILPSGKKILLEPVQRHGNRISLPDFDPCLIVLNNDLSAGIPALLHNIQQKILPPLALSWDTRLKSTHFQHYAAVTEELAAHIGIDPWLMTPLFTYCDGVDFMRGEGEACVVEKTAALLEKIQAHYDHYQIKTPPFVVVKADAGTYGMAVMMIQRPEQLQKLNRKQRLQMAKVKNGKAVTRVIIQEGVYTQEMVNDSVAEPVIYTLGRNVIGGFYRVHAERGENENLNSPGSYFEPMAFEASCNQPRHNEACDETHNLFYLYGIIARLALIAAARELKDVQPTEGK